MKEARKKSEDAPRENAILPPGGRVGEPKTTPPPGTAPAKWPRDLDENAILKNTEFQRFDEQNIMSYKTMNNKIGARTARRRERSFAGGGLRKRPRRLDEKQKTQRRVDEKPGLSRGGAKAATAPRRETKNATARRREARFRPAADSGGFRRIPADSGGTGGNGQVTKYCKGCHFLPK